MLSHINNLSELMILDINSSVNKPHDYNNIKSTIINNYSINLSILPNLTKLDCSWNSVKSIDNIGISMINLNCSHNRIDKLIITHLVNLLYLKCNNNNIYIFEIPQNLIELKCNINLLCYIYDFPISLTRLNYASNNNNNINLSCLVNLLYLNLSSNKILSLDDLPCNITKLYCGENIITSLNNLPQNLIELYCCNNKLTNLDNLPCSLMILVCSFNKFNSFDKLPDSLTKLIYLSTKIIISNDLPHNLLELEYYQECNLINLPHKLKIKNKFLIFNKKTCLPVNLF